MLREKKTPAWETVKFILRMVIFYAPLLLSVVTEVEAEGFFAAIGTIFAGWDKWQFSKTGKGLTSF